MPSIESPSVKLCNPECGTSAWTLGMTVICLIVIITKLVSWHFSVAFMSGTPECFSKGVWSVSGKGENKESLTCRALDIPGEGKWGVPDVPVQLKWGVWTFPQDEGFKQQSGVGPSTRRGACTPQGLDSQAQRMITNFMTQAGWISSFTWPSVNYGTWVLQSHPL